MLFKETIRVGGEVYLHRRMLFPKNRWFNVYYHKFMRDDDHRAHHDHPFISLSVCLKNGYYEEFPDGTVKRRRAGSLVFRRAIHKHIIKLVNGRPAHTIFIVGPMIREWGFWCNGTFKHHQEYHDDHGC